MCLAIPGKIVEFVPATQSTAVVDVAGVRRRVDLGLLENDPPQIGDWVLIHVGFAMSKISEQDAIEQMNTLAILGEAEAAMQEVRGYGLHDEQLDAPAAPPMDAAPLPHPDPGTLRRFEPS
jgi:hydrogenase expression/formation protein HypC